MYVSHRIGLMLHPCGTPRLITRHLLRVVPHLVCTRREQTKPQIHKSMRGGGLSAPIRLISVSCLT
jgi:hypothetical protein